jgi:hypothetical protein
LVCSNVREKCFRLNTPVSAVAWWTIASGLARSTACWTASRSRASITVGSAPIARTTPVFAGERVVATTS